MRFVNTVIEAWCYAGMDRPEGCAEGWVCVAMPEPIEQRMVAVVALRTLARNERCFSQPPETTKPRIAGL